MPRLHAPSIIESATVRLFFDKSGHGRRSCLANGRPIQVVLYANTSKPMNCGCHGQVAALAGFTCICVMEYMCVWSICVMKYNMCVCGLGEYPKKILI